jgi:hypothetical protein
VRASTPALYAAAAGRVVARHRQPRLRGHEERLIFVCGSPRSGTTFLAGVLGSLPGLVDLGEVKPVKALIPRIATARPDDAARELRRVLQRVRRLSLSTHLRGVEQTPETAFVLGAALRAYPQARAVHLVRDGRDVVCSLLERGWLSGGRAGADDVDAAYGAHARFWVEPDRVEEFAHASDAKRAAWAWRRYVTAARSVHERVIELRYEQMVREPDAAAQLLATHLDVDADAVRSALGRAHAGSVGRWRSELTPEQVEDVEREAGTLLRELAYSAGGERAVEREPPAVLHRDDGA